ncbi:hypothetical protein [Pleomorphomonas sp. PLEO]|uniref:hypothetical protein n=1 Tax=Pleomorphomonas sp. PLEO TaxID=3239306 RepID=UPI00351E8C9D
MSTTGGQGQSASGSDSSQQNTPYNFGSDSGSNARLSQTVSNLYASVANSATMASSAGVAA